MYQVIIADDEAKIRGGIVNLFPWKQLGFEIAGSFSNGKEAWEFTLSHPVDLILTDIRMPIMDGLELSEQLLPHTKAKIIFSAATRILNMHGVPFETVYLTTCLNQ